MRSWRIPEAGRFLSVGLVNTFFGLLIIYATKLFWHFGDVAANVVGYAAGLILSFVLNKRWTFVHSGPWLPALTRFIFVAFVAYGINLATVMTAISYFDINSYVAQAIGIAPYALTTYLASKHLVFRKYS